MKIKTTIWQKIILIIASINILDGYEKILFIHIINWNNYLNHSFIFKIGYLIGFYFKPFILGLFLLVITIVDIKNKNNKNK